MEYAHVNLICGARGYGKSTFTEKVYVANSQFKNVVVYLEDIDCYGDAFAAYPLISIWDYRGGKVRINANEIEYLDFIRLLKKFRNTMVIIDEAGMYEKEKLSNEIVEIIKPGRKYNIEFVLMYHGVSELPIGSFKYVNNVILFHQAEEFQSKQRVPKIKELQAAKFKIEEQVKRGNKYYSICIKLC